MHILKRHSSIFLLLTIIIVSIFIHSLPFYTQHSNPLGYDSGFYRRYLIEPNISFPNQPVPGLGNQAFIPRIILDSTRYLEIPTEFALYGTYILWLTILPVLIYFLIDLIFKNKKTALIGALLVVISPIQYVAFWFMFWKNALATCFLILAFISIEKKKWIFLLVLDMLIAMTHTTTSIMYISALGILMFTDIKNWKKYFLNILITSGFVLGLQPQTYSSIVSDPVGVFMAWNEYIALSFPILILALYGLYKSFSIINKSSIFGFFLATSIFTIFRLPFYERIFVFFDLAVIIFSSYGIFTFVSRLNYFSSRKKMIISAVLIIFFGAYVGGLSKQINELQPLVSKNDIENIKSINSFVSDSSTILTTTNEAPWLQGFTLAHIAAPGMLHDVHNQTEWDEIWSSTSTTSQKIFLSKYSHPLFIYTNEDITELLGANNECLTLVSRSLWIDSCN